MLDLLDPRVQRLRRVLREHRNAFLREDWSAVEPRVDEMHRCPTLRDTGCELLLDRWHALGRLLEANGEWTDAQKALAFDLLGSASELRLGEPWEWAGHDSPRALVEREIERLERLKTGSLDQLDAFERASAEQGLGIELARPLVQLNREEAASVRRFQWAYRQLHLRPTIARETVSLAPPPERRPQPRPYVPEPTEEEYIEYEKELYRKLLAEREAKQPVPDAPVQASDVPSEPVPVSVPIPVSAAPAVKCTPVGGNRRARRAARSKAARARR